MNPNGDEWVDIVVKRAERDANLTVADSAPVSGRSPGRTYGLTLLTPLYLGGYNQSQISLPASIGALHHFEGCIGQVSVGVALGMHWLMI